MPVLGRWRRRRLAERILIAAKELLYEDERALRDWALALEYAALPHAAKAKQKVYHGG